MESKVVNAELWQRPLKNLDDFKLFGLVHKGVVVTLENGARYLIHKFPKDDAGISAKIGTGVNKGASGDVEGDDTEGKAVIKVVKADSMGRKWEKIKDKPVQKSTIQDFIKACGQKYRLFSDNCINAANNMMAIP